MAQEVSVNNSTSVGVTISGAVQAATQAQVDAGIIANKYVSPKTLNDWSGGSSAWGSITGTLSAQTDLQAALNAKWGVTGTTTLTGDATIAGATTNAVYFGGASPSGVNELDYFGVNVKLAAGSNTIVLRSYDDEALFNNDSSLEIRSNYAYLYSNIQASGQSTIKASGATAQIEADTINFDSVTTGNFIQLYDDGVSIFRTTINSQVNMSGLPTSSAGLSSGDLWNNSGVINIV